MTRLCRSTCLCSLVAISVLACTGCGDSDADCGVKQNGPRCDQACQAGTVCALVYLGEGPQTFPKCVTVSAACADRCISCDCMTEEDCPLCKSSEVEGQTYLTCDEYCGPNNANHCM